MAILLIVALVGGYVWSVWLLWRQMHFEGPFSPLPTHGAESLPRERRSREHPIVDRQPLHRSPPQTAHASVGRP